MEFATSTTAAATKVPFLTIDPVLNASFGTASVLSNRGALAPQLGDQGGVQEGKQDLKPPTCCVTLPSTFHCLTALPWESGTAELLPHLQEDLPTLMTLLFWACVSSVGRWTGDS